MCALRRRTAAEKRSTMASNGARPPKRSGEAGSGRAQPKKLNLSELEHSNSNTGLATNLVLSGGYFLTCFFSLMLCGFARNAQVLPAPPTLCRVSQTSSLLISHTQGFSLAQSPLRLIGPNFCNLRAPLTPQKEQPPAGCSLAQIYARTCLLLTNKFVFRVSPDWNPRS